MICLLNENLRKIGADLPLRQKMISMLTGTSILLY